MKAICWLVAGTLAAFPVVAAADQAAPVTVKPIVTTTTTASGQKLRLPQGDVTLTASEYVIAPGARLPVHKHPFPRFAYVLEGTLSVSVADTGQTFVYNAGDVVVEVVDQWHYGVNAGPATVRLIVFDQVPGNQPQTILKN